MYAVILKEEERLIDAYCDSFVESLVMQSLEERDKLIKKKIKTERDVVCKNVAKKKLTQEHIDKAMKTHPFANLLSVAEENGVSVIPVMKEVNINAFLYVNEPPIQVINTKGEKGVISSAFYK